MKKYFITGLVILLPLALTLVVVGFVFNLLTDPFLGLTRAVMAHYGLLNTGFLFLSASQLQTIVSQILIISTLFLFTLLLGILARWFFLHYIIGFWESLIQRIPLVSSIYNACKDVIKTVFGSKTNAFKQVVLIRFPNPETLTLGLVTRQDLPGINPFDGEELFVVFVPTTPNPTSGFLTIVKREDAVKLDMSIEEAFKYIISCGVIMPSFKKGESQTIVPDIAGHAFILGDKGRSQSV